MPAEMQIRFSSDRFVIESATLWLFRWSSELEAPKNPGDIDSLDVIEGSVKASIPKPGPLEGMLIGIRLRRLADGKISSPVWSEFSHQVSETDWRSGVAIVNLNNYKEVLIKVQDSQGYPVSGGRIGFGPLKGGKEGGMDFTTDANGEITLLLSPGMYGASARGGNNRFEVTTEDIP